MRHSLSLCLFFCVCMCACIFSGTAVLLLFVTIPTTNRMWIYVRRVSEEPCMACTGCVCMETSRQATAYVGLAYIL